MWSQFKGTSSKANMYFGLKNKIKLEKYSTIFTGKIRNSICRSELQMIDSQWKLEDGQGKIMMNIFVHFAAIIK